MRGDERVNKNNRKGFTLAELLIVVAIIAVLVAISIPIFHAQLRKARLATNQANGRAAFSAAEAAYLDYVAAHGSVPINTDSYDKKWVTYTYFTEAGKDILNFTRGGMYWLYGGGTVKVSNIIDVSKWTVDTVLSDDAQIGDRIARIWTVYMDPSNGQIKGYYCAYPSANDLNDKTYKDHYIIYKNIVKALSSGGDISQWQQADTR